MSRATGILTTVAAVVKRPVIRPVDRVLWLGAVVTVMLPSLFVAFMLAHPGDEEFVSNGNDAITLSCEAFAALLCALALARSRHARQTAATDRVPPAAIMALGLGVLGALVGDGIMAYYDIVLQQPLPVPSAADLFYLSTDPFLLAGTLILMRRLPIVTRALRVLDGVMVITALVTFSWYYVLGPTLLDGAGSIAEKVVNAAYPVSDLILCCCLFLLLGTLRGHRQRPIGVLMAIAFVCILIADSIYDYESLQGTYPISGEVGDVGLPLAYLLIGMSALLLANTRLGSDTHYQAVAIRRRRHPLIDALPLGLLPAVLVLLVATRHAGDTSALTIGVDIGTTLLVALVLLRQVLSQRENNEYARELERLNADLRGLTSDKQRLAAANSQLEVLASTDALTRLPNRGILRERLRMALEYGDDRGTSPIALLLLDLDRFKEVNDTLGHDVGDQLLVEVGDRLRQTARRTDTIARLGGDEFAVLLPGASNEGAEIVARSMRAAIEQPFLVDGQSISVGVSVGIAVAPEHGLSEATLLQHADVAMYHAKRGGLGQALYDPACDGHDARRLSLLADLQQAIVEGALVLHYQPEVAVASGKVVGVEALVRWPHPTHGMMPPDSFIPLAEQTGLIVPLTTWVLDAALAQIARWSATDLDISVSVNLSLRNLRDPALCETVAHLLQLHGVPPARLCLELTETMVMADVEGTKAMLAQLAALGVRLSIDDFGTGYSSLAYLSRLPVHELKIDRSFVKRLTTEHTDQTIVASTIGLGHALGLTVVTEGIEDAETWALLETMHSDVGQGYFLARPAPAEELEPWLRHSQTAGRELVAAHGPREIARKKATA